MARTLLPAAVLLVAILLSTNALSYIKILLQSDQDPTKCPIFDARAPPSFHKDNSLVLRILYDQDYRLESVARLSGAVQVDTTVEDWFSDVAETPDNWVKFEAFHEYLMNAFPNVFREAEVSTVNTYGLVINWRGSDESLKPLLLAAHQDVVPVQHETLDEWTYPPFSGHYDGESVFGRGAFDCKNSLIALMEAMELLISQGYKNKRSVIAALGFDEEISGQFGAKKIGKYLEETYGKDSMYAIIDEGPGLITDPITGTLLAVPATGEKGLFDVKVKLTMPGGHSSVPFDHGAIGIMGELAKDIEEDPYESILTERNPILKFLQCIAVASGDKMKSIERKTIFRAGFDKFANSLIRSSLSKKKLTKYLIRTSQAVDVIRGGEKVNALPEDVTLLVNHRLAVETTIEEAMKRFNKRVYMLSKKYNLNMTAFGEDIYSSKNAIGYFHVLEFRPHLKSAPVSPSTGRVWEYLAASTRHIFENLVLNNTLGYPIATAPAIMPANTDTKHYWNLTRHIYRFSPMIVDMLDCNIHSVNEKVPVDGHLQLTAWYYEYIQNVDTSDADDKIV